MSRFIAQRFVLALVSLFVFVMAIMLHTLRHTLQTINTAAFSVKFGALP